MLIVGNPVTSGSKTVPAVQVTPWARKGPTQYFVSLRMETALLEWRWAATAPGRNVKCCEPLKSLAYQPQ
jgi:hypothetical protein